MTTHPKPKGTFAKLMSSPPPPPQSTTQQTLEGREAAQPTGVEKPVAASSEQKKLLGARITPRQYAMFKKLPLQLNNNDLNSNIDKGEIVGLAIETLADVLEGTHEDFPTVEKLKSYVVNKLTKILES